MICEDCGERLKPFNYEYLICENNKCPSINKGLDRLILKQEEWGVNGDGSRHNP